MKGLELAERFYLEYGEPMLREFPELLPYIAVGLVGSGSECLGFDDELSRDHDFEAGFCIFIPDEDKIDSRSVFALERAYARLPKEYMGYARVGLVPADGKRHGVIRISDLLERKIGRRDGELVLSDWLTLPEQNLLELTNGRIFFDGSGKITRIRNNLSYLPEDVRRKKLAGELILMGQAGQYNYSRCIARGETAAAQLAACEFVKSALHVIFIINRRYLPYYKWTFRALTELPIFSELHTPLEYLISSTNTADETKIKKEMIESICAKIVAEIKSQNLSDFSGTALEGHAFSVNETISTPELRALHILAAV